MDINKTKAIVFEALNEARNLGISIAPNGGYASGYNKDKLPPYSVGLFGALSVVLGDDARSKIGLTFNETMALEAAFNSRPSKLKKKKAYPELEALGKKLAIDYCYGKKNKKSSWDSIEEHLTTIRSSGPPRSLSYTFPVADPVYIGSASPTIATFTGYSMSTSETAHLPISTTPRDTNTVERWDDGSVPPVAANNEQDSPQEGSWATTRHQGRSEVVATTNRFDESVRAEYERLREQMRVLRVEQPTSSQIMPVFPSSVQHIDLNISVDGEVVEAEQEQPSASRLSQYPRQNYNGSIPPAGTTTINTDNVGRVASISAQEEDEVSDWIVAGTEINRQLLQTQITPPQETPSTTHNTRRLTQTLRRLQPTQDRAAGVSEEAYREALIQRARERAQTGNMDGWREWNAYCEDREDEE